MKGHIHYEKAFEHAVRQMQLPYVAVDEAKRAAFRDAKLKSFDFIVYAPGGTNWLIDVKGRRWTARGKSRKPAWENWATQADLDGLKQWQEVFGVGFRALLGKVINPLGCLQVGLLQQVVGVDAAPQPGVHPKQHAAPQSITMPCERFA